MWSWTGKECQSDDDSTFTEYMSDVSTVGSRPTRRHQKPNNNGPRTENKSANVLNSAIMERAYELLDLPSGMCHLLDIFADPALSCNEKLMAKGHYCVSVNIQLPMNLHGKFHGAVAVSAIQWLFQQEDPAQSVFNFFQFLITLMSRSAHAVFQFCPANRQQWGVMSEQALLAGFNGEIVVNPPHWSIIFWVLSAGMPSFTRPNTFSTKLPIGPDIIGWLTVAAAGRDNSNHQCPPLEPISSLELVQQQKDQVLPSLAKQQRKDQSDQQQHPQSSGRFSQMGQQHSNSAIASLNSNIMSESEESDSLRRHRERLLAHPRPGNAAQKLYQLVNLPFRAEFDDRSQNRAAAPSHPVADPVPSKDHKKAAHTHKAAPQITIKIKGGTQNIYSGGIHYVTPARPSADDVCLQRATLKPKGKSSRTSRATNDLARRESSSTDRRTWH